MGTLFFLSLQFVAGTDEYDRRPDRKLRCPGWCDRILWKTNNSLYFGESSADDQDGFADLQRKSLPDDRSHYSLGYVKALSYERSENIISDHKPINATFCVSTIKIDAEAKQNAMLRAVATWHEQTKGSGVLAVSIAPHYLAVSGCSDSSASSVMVGSGIYICARSAHSLLYSTQFILAN